MDGAEVRELRLHAGLSVASVACSAGLDELAVAAIESGADTCTRLVLDRVRAMIAAGTESPIHRNHLLTVSALSAALRSGLAAGWPTADLLRMVREMRSNAKFVAAGSCRDAFYFEPESTGDARWDAMVAGCVEDLAMRLGAEPPTWCRGHALDTFWFVGSAPSLWAYAFAHSPFPLHIRGVMVDPGDLEPV